MPQPLQGELIRLRAREETDVDHFYRWINDWQVTEVPWWPLPAQQGVRMEVARCRRPGSSGGAVRRRDLAERRAIGWVGLHPASSENRVASLGIAIGEQDFSKEVTAPIRCGQPAASASR
ncbi:MAG: GNAT family N-acetyltransferase [Dehalococcoidia bacterium]|nr:GNAT family N-acetyltransferase [Dehalococcoidia bacterium]